MLKNIKQHLRKIFYKVPGVEALWIKANKNKKHHEFSGWGMTSNAYTPWHMGGGDTISRDFLKTQHEIEKLAVEGRFKIDQFEHVRDNKNNIKALRGLMWRHYIVFWSARYAFRATRGIKNLVECGVCNGMTAYFAMSALRDSQFRVFLYDAWEGMKEDNLLESEKGQINKYSDILIADTKNNLVAFKDKTVFIKGIIPKSLESSDKPAELIWLHIDLNSSGPTLSVLAEFFDKIVPGGVVLFDDYAWRSYYDTKVAVDKFFSDKKGILLPLPTGQAIFFKQ